ncbi:MAG: hypothetical protein AAB912_02035, partial [Patescibacteria group bacterium]
VDRKLVNWYTFFMKIKYVNGADIRNTTNTDFAAYLTTIYDAAVPKGELWLESSLKPETAFFLHVVETEEKMYRAALAAARKKLGRQLTTEEKNVIMVREFIKIRALLSKEGKKHGPPPPFVKKLERRGRLTLMWVNGAIVRKYIDPYFSLGGHHFVYSYIPKNEIWIDDLNYPEDQEFTIIHELHERTLMARGMDYHSAHDYALAEERYHRRKAGVARFING